MLRYIVVAFMLTVFATPAFAQSPPLPPDPRTVHQMIEAYQAMVNLRDAQLKALIEDAKKRESDWSEYSKPLWQPPANIATAPADK